MVVTSLDNRLVMVENGGYVVVNLIVAWAMFMPTGLRFSVDAMVRSYEEHKEKSVGDLNHRFRPTEGYASHPLDGIYHPSRLQVLDSCRRAEGTVALVRHEEDGDLHTPSP